MSKKVDVYNVFSQVKQVITDYAPLPGTGKHNLIETVNSLSETVQRLKEIEIGKEQEPLEQVKFLSLLITLVQELMKVVNDLNSQHINNIGNWSLPANNNLTVIGVLEEVIKQVMILERRVQKLEIGVGDLNLLKAPSIIEGLLDATSEDKKSTFTYINNIKSEFPNLIKDITGFKTSIELLEGNKTRLLGIASNTDREIKDLKERMYDVEWEVNSFDLAGLYGRIEVNGVQLNEKQAKDLTVTELRDIVTKAVGFNSPIDIYTKRTNFSDRTLRNIVYLLHENLGLKAVEAENKEQASKGSIIALESTYRELQRSLTEVKDGVKNYDFVKTNDYNTTIKSINSSISGLVKKEDLKNWVLDSDLEKVKTELKVSNDNINKVNNLLGFNASVTNLKNHYSINFENKNVAEGVCIINDLYSGLKDLGELKKNNVSTALITTDVNAIKSNLKTQEATFKDFYIYYQDAVKRQGDDLMMTVEAVKILQSFLKTKNFEDMRSLILVEKVTTDNNGNLKVNIKTLPGFKKYITDLQYTNFQKYTEITNKTRDNLWGIESDIKFLIVPDTYFFRDNNSTDVYALYKFLRFQVNNDGKKTGVIDLNVSYTDTMGRTALSGQTSYARNQTFQIVIFIDRYPSFTDNLVNKDNGLPVFTLTSRVNNYYTGIVPERVKAVTSIVIPDKQIKQEQAQVLAPENVVNPIAVVQPGGATLTPEEEPVVNLEEEKKKKEEEEKRRKEEEEKKKKEEESKKKVQHVGDLAKQDMENFLRKASRGDFSNN